MYLVYFLILFTLSVLFAQKATHSRWAFGLFLLLPFVFMMMMIDMASYIGMWGIITGMALLYLQSRVRNHFVFWPLALGLALLPSLPYLVVEYQTAAFDSPDFRRAALKASNTAMGDGDSNRCLFVRVMDSHDNHAQVYVISSFSAQQMQDGPCNMSSLVNLQNTNGKWRPEHDPGYLLSSGCGGSADGWTFPPYPNPNK